MTHKIEEMTFEQAFAALNKTLEKLEAGDLPLAEAMTAYEYGMALTKHCGVQLDTAELKIKKLTPAGEKGSYNEQSQKSFYADRADAVSFYSTTGSAGRAAFTK